MASVNPDDQKVDKVICSENHVDDSLQATSSGGREDLPGGYCPGTAEERAMNRSLNRKLDIFLLPFLSLLYLFNGLDRGNVGNAETQGKHTIL